MSNNNFIFPEFNKDSQRIKFYSRKYKNMSLGEAFADFYGDPSIKAAADTIEEMYNVQQVAIGSRVRVKFDNVTKGKVAVVSNNPKELFATKHNVWSWNNLDTDLWYDAEVVDKTNNQYMVDILTPIKDQFVASAKKTIKNYFQSTTVTVRDLQIQRGGYLGKINVDAISKITGQPYLIDAFIPGSMIALNIEKDFNKWDGQSVDAMIVNFTDNNGKPSIVCSRKKYLNSLGQSSLISLYDNIFRDGGQYDETFEGVVTGVINSANKKGVFVEIPEYCITGLIQMNPSELVNFRIGADVKVKISGVEWDEKREPYKRSAEGIIYECNLKPTLVLV